MRVDISDETFSRLQALAIPLVDSVEDVIVRILDSYVAEKEYVPKKSVPQMPPASSDRAPAMPPTAPRREALYGFRKELWELVIKKLPRDFSLHDVYRHQGPLVECRPHVQEMEATIRNAMQRLRDMGYVEFVSRGEYRRID